MAQYNLRNPAVKRLMREAAELKFPTEEYFAQPLEDNLFEWHFTLRGPPNTEFEGGVYHGRITLPADYPMKPPSIILLTPNGRFEINKKICLSISGHHPETWQPSWSIRTALLAMIGFMPTHGNGAIGSLDYTPEERKLLAIKSQNWKCPNCGLVENVLRVESTGACTKEVHILGRKEKTELEFDSNLNGSLSNISSLVNKSINYGQTQNGVAFNRMVRSCDSISAETACNGDSSISKRIETDSVPRLRHLSSPQEKDSSNIVKSDEIKTTSSYCSLIFIWVIVFILVILISRRLLYQCCFTKFC